MLYGQKVSEGNIFLYLKVSRQCVWLSLLNENDEYARVCSSNPRQTIKKDVMLEKQSY